MANFVRIGGRAINLDLVCMAHKDETGRLTVYFAAPAQEQPMHWVVTDRAEAEALWVKIAPQGQDLSEVRGGPLGVTDNESTPSRQPR